MVDEGVGMVGELALRNNGFKTGYVDEFNFPHSRGAHLAFRPDKAMME